MKTPPKSKIDRLYGYFIKFQDYKEELKREYGVSENYIHGSLKVKHSVEGSKS